MALEASRPTRLSAAIVELSSLARGCRDRVWQRELLELAAACSAYSKVPRPEDEARILAKARGIVAAAPQLGQEASASAAAAVIAALTSPEPPSKSPASSVPAPSQSTAPPLLSATTGPTLAPLQVGTDQLVSRPTRPPALGADPSIAGFQDTRPLDGRMVREGEPLVLVVDGDAQSRRVMTTYFKAAGFRVAAFDDGGQAIATIRHERPALIVVELVLPMMPGEVLILALRRSPATATIPILVVTAEPWRLGSEHQVEAILTKPVNVTVVVEAARRLVSASAGTDSLHKTPRF